MIADLFTWNPLAGPKMENMKVLWTDSIIKLKKQTPRAFPFFCWFTFWISYKPETPYVHCLIHLFLRWHFLQRNSSFLPFQGYSSSSITQISWCVIDVCLAVHHVSQNRCATTCKQRILIVSMISTPQFRHTYLHKAVIGGEVVSHGISPALVVSFEEWEEGADLLEDLEIKQDKTSVCQSEEDAPYHWMSTHTAVVTLILQSES